MHKITDHFADPILDDMISREVLVDNRENSSELEDYQVDLTIDEKQLFFEAQDGLQFVDDNLKIIDHWNESFPNKLWIKIPKILSSAMSALRKLEGITSSASDIDSTFLFGDDFSSASLDIDKWDLKQGVIESNQGALELVGTSETRGLLESKTAITIGSALHVSAKSDSNDNFFSGHFCGLRKASDWSYKAGDLFGYAGVSNRGTFQTRDNGSTTETAALVLQDCSNYHNYKVTWITDISKAYQDNNLLCTHTTNIPTIDNIIVFYEATSASYSAWIDFVFACKYTSPEPTAEIGAML